MIFFITHGKIGGPGTIDKSFNAIKYNGWIHLAGFLASVSPISSSMRYYEPFLEH